MKYLKIHTLAKGQWYDRDTVLLHSAFQVLVDFIEQERPNEIVDWQHDELHRNAWSEISKLYKWWKEERPNRHDPLDGVASPPAEEYWISEEGRLVFPDRGKYPEYYAAMDKSSELESKWHEEDQRNLHRLIEVRPFLWT
jgi:hypothetical protein